MLIGTLIISVIAFDLLSSGVNLVWTAERAAFETKPELVSVLENAKLKEDPQFRYRILPHSGTIPDSFMPQLKNATIFYNALYIYQTLQVNFGSEWGFRHAMGLWPGNTFKNSVFQDAFNQSDEKKRLDIALSLEQILAVKYLLTSNPTEDMLHNYLQSSDYRLFYRSDQTETFIFELKNPVPRARFTRNSIQTEHEENMLEAISRARELGFDFSDQVLLLKQESFSAVQQVPAEEDDVYRSVAPVLSEQGPNQVTVTLETPFSGYLVLADQWLPGWSAFEHAEERPILLANYMQRAVRLPPGKHQIKFKYEAPGFKFAVIISLLGLFLFLLSLWWLPVQIRQPERN